MIKVINLTTNEVVGVYESIGEISEQLGIDKGNISKVLNGKRKSCNGFTFVNDSDNSVTTDNKVTTDAVTTNNSVTTPLKKVTTPLRAVKPKEVMNKFEKSLRYNENLTVDELVDAVEDCYNWIWDGVDVNNPNSQGYLLVSELSRIVFNVMNLKMLKWSSSKRRWLHEDTVKLNAVKDLLGSREDDDYYKGVESALNQIVTTDNPIVRCFWLSLFYQYNRLKNEDKIKFNN